MPSTSFAMDVLDRNLGMTALAGGASPSAAANICVIGTNTITTCATAGDSVKLPAGAPRGARVIVANLAAAKADVFPNAGATINAAAADANLGLAAITVAEFIQIGDTGLTWLATGVSAAQS
jgi:hypothetical protein